MQQQQAWNSPIAFVQRQRPDQPVFCFAPKMLQTSALRFLSGFPGLVTYAVKANPSEEVLANLVAAGLDTFDVASPQEMTAVRAICPKATLHYHNPVRSLNEVSLAAAMNVTSWSVDRMSELEKLTHLPKRTEVAVRVALPVQGAAYDFGSKFGAGPTAAQALLQRVAEMGFQPSITFHPGTQCADPEAWASYIKAAADIARHVEVPLARLNVGGGFAAHRAGAVPDLEAIFARISKAAADAFGANTPALVCEPGRAMVAEAVTLVTRVKAADGLGTVFLNDGIYGGLAEVRDMALGNRVRVIASDGRPRCGKTAPHVVFGPTCDSVDRLPDPLDLPCDVSEGDYVLFDGMGAYTQSLATRFNGYGACETVTVANLH